MCAYRKDGHTFLYCPRLSEDNLVNNNKIDDSREHAGDEIAEDKVLREKALEEDDQKETDAKDTKVGDVVHEHASEIFSCDVPYPVVPYQKPAECESDDDGTFK